MAKPHQEMLVRMFIEDEELLGCLEHYARVRYNAEKNKEPIAPLNEAILRTIDRVYSGSRDTNISNFGDKDTLTNEEEHA